MPTPFSPRSRVLRSISHQEVDRPPRYFGAEDEVWERVMREVGARDRVEVLRHFGADTIQVSQYSRGARFEWGGDVGGSGAPPLARRRGH